MIDNAKIEKKWQKAWKKARIYEPDLGKVEKPFYNLMMFPYPSAEGLHVGNMYAFTGADVYGRFKRMQGYDVFEPIGLDGFGIHSENYALKINAHPMEQSKVSEKRFYKQLEMIGNGFSWDSRIETYNPSYYRWTQWLFLQLFKSGLAYRKMAAVNWCPHCKTVLADEQVIAGKCERCSTLVEKKELAQWFFRITRYAEKLLKNIEGLDWSENIKIAQRNWIGKSEGAVIKFAIRNPKFEIHIFTTRPDTILGATFLVLSPEHSLIPHLADKIENYKEVERYVYAARNKSESARIETAGEKTGIPLKGITAINPATNTEIPVWVSDYVLASYGTGAVMGVPAYDKRDREFAEKFRLTIVMSELINPEDAVKRAGGAKDVRYHLRDWLISRQRYWGAPIPMIFCEDCKKSLENSKFKIQNSKLSRGELENPGWIAVPEKDLPVKLPNVKEFRPTGTGKAPLASVKSFYETKCPKCGGRATRETDVCDTFLDSSWYYIGYLLLAKNSKFNPFGELRVDGERRRTINIQNSKFRSIMKRWLPVDSYIGGAEHAVLHLLYSRFVAMALRDLGFTHFDEPFAKFRAHGLLISKGAKMSKSKGNIVIPDEYIKKFGADTFRTYLMFLAPLSDGGDFQDKGIAGIARFLARVWRFGEMAPIKLKNSSDPKIARILHKTIKKVTEDIELLRYNTAISALMILFNEMERHLHTVSRAQWTTFLKLLAPLAPHLTEELYQRVRAESGERGFQSIHVEKWPSYNRKLIADDIVELIIQVNGKIRDKVSVPADIGEEEAKRIALENEKAQRAIGGLEVKRVVFVPGKLINIVV